MQNIYRFACEGARLILCLPLLFAAPFRTHAQTQAGPVVPCNVPGMDGDVRCTSVIVPEDRRKKGGRTIAIALVIARATGTDRRPDPLVLLAGGPGQSGIQMGAFASEAFAAARSERDVVLIDVRGTGRSNGLQCALMRTPADFGGGTIYPPASLKHCRDSLAAVADLMRYTTSDIVEDLEHIRRTLGWKQINIYGTSYGSRLAFAFVRRYPNSVRSVVMKAVAPPTLAAPMNYAADVERALDLLVRDCNADPNCASLAPALRVDLENVLRRADQGMIRVASPIPGTSDSVTVSRDAIVSTVVGAMQSASDRAQIPWLVSRAAKGDLTLAGLVVRTRATLDRILYAGMHLSVLCAETRGRLDLAKADRESVSTLLGSSRVRMTIDACRQWPTDRSHKEETSPVRAKVPMLLVSGELDPNLPPRHAESALRHLPNAKSIVLKGVAHGWSNVVLCGRAFVADFFRSPASTSIDTGCATQSSAPPFINPSR